MQILLAHLEGMSLLADLVVRAGLPVVNNLLKFSHRIQKSLLYSQQRLAELPPFEMVRICL